jgi:hypothetical protein
MTKDDVKRILQAEIASRSAFENFHGITEYNLDDFIVEPYQVLVEPDDGSESETRFMWVVLKEYRPNDNGYLIAYDPLTDGWKLIEKQQNERIFAEVLGADTFAEALTGM